MKFSTKRGRPKNENNEIDLGTKELREKKQSDNFKNPLEILKQKAVIQQREYEIALWFRYLYSVKFGNPNMITAYNIAKINGLSLFKLNTKKQIKIENIYNKISSELQKNKLKNIIMDVCIYDYKNISQINKKGVIDKILQGLKIILSFYNIAHDN